MKSALTFALLSTTLLMPMAVQAQENDCQMYNAEASVFFTSGSVELGSTAMAVIDQLAENIQADNSCVVDTLTVTGHVDWKEIKTSSPMMSFVRAMTVGDVLVGKGIVTDVIGVAGYGARVSNPDGNGMIATERRAEIKITMRASATE